MASHKKQSPEVGDRQNTNAAERIAEALKTQGKVRGNRGPAIPGQVPGRQMIELPCVDILECCVSGELDQKAYELFQGSARAVRNASHLAVPSLDGEKFTDQSAADMGQLFKDLLAAGRNLDRTVAIYADDAFHLAEAAGGKKEDAQPT